MKPPPPATASRSSVKVHIQEIDAELFQAAYQAAFDMELIEELTSERLGAREVWIDALKPSTWEQEQAGSGALTEALQATINDEAATWVHVADVPVLNLATVLRRKDRANGIATFEKSIMGLFDGSLDAEPFLLEMKNLFNRQYALISHVLFLRDPDHFVPVDSQLAEEGLAHLGVDQSLSGTCLWPSYSRFLAHLDRICVLAGEQGESLNVQEAYSFLILLGKLKA